MLTILNKLTCDGTLTLITNSEVWLINNKLAVVRTLTQHKHGDYYPKTVVIDGNLTVTSYDCGTTYTATIVGDMLVLSEHTHYAQPQKARLYNVMCEGLLIGTCYFAGHNVHMTGINGHRITFYNDGVGETALYNYTRRTPNMIEVSVVMVWQLIANESDDADYVRDTFTACGLTTLLDDDVLHECLDMSQG